MDNLKAKGEAGLKIDDLNLNKAYKRIRALRHKLRKQILYLIDQYDKITVTEIYIKLRLEQSVASQHLSILRKEGFLKTRRTGKYIFYSVDRVELEKFHDKIELLLD